jgi:predicted enzyme related to lactoylglutathione lyase
VQAAFAERGMARCCSTHKYSVSELESRMNEVKVEQRSYEMPPRQGFAVAHFLTVADLGRSARFYETVFGGQILSGGDSSGTPGYIQLANTWLILNVGGGPTPDKPSVTLSVPPDPDRVSSFMNMRVADIQASYELWQSRGAAFITEPKDKYGETRCYIRDPDGYLIEVGETKPDLAFGRGSDVESGLDEIRVRQKGYELPPREGFSVAHFLTVADVGRSARFYESVFEGRILTMGDSIGAPAFIQIANAWLIVYFGGGPTPDKPSVTLSVPANPDAVSSFMSIRVADIRTCYELWRHRGAEFITDPKDKLSETCCYIRDPDGYIIEVGQSKPGFPYG